MSDCHYVLSGVEAGTGYTSVIGYKERASDGTSYYKKIDNVTVTAGAVTNLDIFLEAASNTPAVFGVVRNAVTNAPMSGASVVMDDGPASSTVTAGGGLYFLMPISEGEYTLTSKLSGYKTLNPITRRWGKGIMKAPDLMLQPVGSISGNITDETTGDPVADVRLNIKDPAGNVVATGKSDATGYYLISDVYAGNNYSIEPAIDPDVIQVTFPASGLYKGVNVSTGVTTPNKDFKTRETYGTISGYVNVDGVDLKNGVTVLAYPSSMPTPVHAHDFKVNNANPNSKKHGGRGRMNSPYYGTATDGSAEYTISVPAGQNYDIYAYYTYVSYTGNAKNPVKKVKNYYKVRTNVPVNSAGQDLSGNLSSWTLY
jgi:hypothetical protein